MVIHALNADGKSYLKRKFIDMTYRPYLNGQKAKIRAAGERLGREGISKRAIELVNDFDGSYKGAVILAGRMRVLSIAAEHEEYWREKTHKGIMNEARYIIDKKND